VQDEQRQRAQHRFFDRDALVDDILRQLEEACEYRMFTSTWSMFGSVVMSKLTLRFISLPLVWLVEYM